MGLDKNFKPVIRFMAVSDIHIKNDDTVEDERFTEALRYAYKIADSSESYKKLDAVCVIGDFANSGSEIEMTKVKKTLDAELKDGTELIMTLASHEFNTRYGGEEEAKERFKRIFNLPLDTHKVINGFHFVAVTTTRGCRFDDPQKEFIKTELKKAAADDGKKPIFFCQHPHLTNTVYGSIDWGEKDITYLLMDYPQIIDFSGHSHAPINDPRSVHQKHFSSFGTGTLSYFELDEYDKISGTVPEDADQAAQFLIVEADAENRVRVYPFDVLTGQFFPQVWKIDVPSDPSTFIYTDKRYKATEAPYFDDSAECFANDITDSSVVLTFTQAKPAPADDYVDAYRIMIRDKKSGIIKKQLEIFSKYYLYDMPSKLSQEIGDLDGKTDYIAEIYPTGFFMTLGEKPLTTEFTTL
ncbi:MAG: metallophosphoesterase [Clostridiales bacterium]|nr:metallophosphoesterase [Clostridiales bacterium]